MTDSTPNFETWLRRVNAKIGLIGLDYRDLPDIDYRGMFDDGCAPREAAVAALEEAGGDAGLLP